LLGVSIIKSCNLDETETRVILDTEKINLNFLRLLTMPLIGVDYLSMMIVVY
jgi:hypothetical protein